jgi:hypothetical protein
VSSLEGEKITVGVESKLGTVNMKSFKVNNEKLSISGRLQSIVRMMLNALEHAS